MLFDVLYKKKSKIFVWKMNFCCVNYYNNMIKINNISVKNINSYKKKIELYNKIIMLDILQIPFKDVFYSNKGKPFIRKNNFYKFISISHSNEFLVIGVSETPIAVDINKMNSIKIMKVINRFIRYDEFIYLDKKYLVYQLHIIWSAKESLYKIQNTGNTSFFSYKIYPFKPFCNFGRLKCGIIRKYFCYIIFAYYKFIKHDYILVFIT